MAAHKNPYPAGSKEAALYEALHKAIETRVTFPRLKQDA